METIPLMCYYTCHYRPGFISQSTKCLKKFEDPRCKPFDWHWVSGCSRVGDNKCPMVLPCSECRWSLQKTLALEPSTCTGLKLCPSPNTHSSVWTIGALDTALNQGSGLQFTAIKRALYWRSHLKENWQSLYDLRLASGILAEPYPGNCAFTW